MDVDIQKFQDNITECHTLFLGAIQDKVRSYNPNIDLVYFGDFIEYLYSNERVALWIPNSSMIGSDLLSIQRLLGATDFEITQAIKRSNGVEPKTMVQFFVSRS